MNKPLYVGAYNDEGEMHLIAEIVTPDLNQYQIIYQHLQNNNAKYQTINYNELEFFKLDNPQQFYQALVQRQKIQFKTLYFGYYVVNGNDDYPTLITNSITHDRESCYAEIMEQLIDDGQVNSKTQYQFEHNPDFDVEDCVISDYDDDVIELNHYQHDHLINMLSRALIQQP